MGTPARRLESQALKLPARERARLAVMLITSLDDEADDEAEDLWAAEAESRLESILTKKVRAKAAGGVFKRARSAVR